MHGGWSDAIRLNGVHHETKSNRGVFALASSAAAALAQPDNIGGSQQQLLSPATSPLVLVRGDGSGHGNGWKQDQPLALQRHFHVFARSSLPKLNTHNLLLVRQTLVCRFAEQARCP